MGVFNVVALAAEASVLACYAGVPLYYGQRALLAADVRAAAQLKQSLAALAALSLARLALFTYIRQRNKRVPSTRCFVFCVSLVEGAVMALASLQPLVFWRNPHAFARFRAVPWGPAFVYALWGLAMASAVLQLWYILQLNKSRGRLADDRLISDVLSEQDAKRARWRTKWDSLVKQFRRKASDPTFEAMVRLYAHRETAMDRVAAAAERSPDEFEFYLPQMCSFLLLGGFAQSPQLCRLLLDKCSASHVFAHKMLWYLQSYCLWNPSFRTDEATRQVQGLIEEVCDRGAYPARAIECPALSPRPGAAATGATSEDDAAHHPGPRRDWTARVAASSSSSAAQEADCLLPATAKDDHYATFRKQVAAIDYVERGVAADPFELETAFLGALANLSSNLRAVAIPRRNEMLQKWLKDLEVQFFPSNSLYLPVGNPFHRIKRLHVSESFTFSTRERVPFLLCLEVVDYPPPAGAGTTLNKRRGSSSVSYARRFTLTMFDKSALSEAGIVPSERTPLVSPDAAALGFWSESKPPSSPTRLRSLSQHLSMSQPAEILHGLIDTLKRKGPGGGKQSSTGCVPDASREALLAPGNGLSVDDSAIREYSSWDIERSQSQPVMKSPALVKGAVSVDSGVARIAAHVSEPPSEAAEIASAAARVVGRSNSRVASRVDVDDSGAWSPRSDTNLSPQSAGSAYSPPALARFDSTDRFIQDMMERDSKLDDEDDANGNGSAPLLVGQRRHSDLPCVIFKERWAEKERRVQATSPYGHLTGWRLLPVIVKSDDDLRQEQLASQLVKQFAKVFEEFQVPVFLRPYDVIAITSTSGLVEAIPDTISIDSLKRNDREFTTLLDFFTRHFGDPSSSAFKQARANFVRSMAAYSIVCYLLQVKDRHNGNLLLDAEGHIIHIDFGFFLSNNPGNMAFEQAPFKLTHDFVELLGGPRSAAFRRYRSLCVRSFLVARKYRHRFILLVEMMLHGNEHLPCFGGDPKGAVEKLAARFQPDLDINSCEDFVHALIDASLDNWRTNWYDRYQRWIVGVF